MSFLKKLFLFLCATPFAFTTPLQERTLDRTALAELMSSLGMDLTEDFVAATQREWLRKPNQERWEVTELTPEQRELVLEWGKKEGLYDAWKPASHQYDKALILGATTSRMQTRLEFLASLWYEGIRFHEIVWLTGERPLDPRVDDLTDRCENEAQAAQIIWDETSLPKEMREIPMLLISVPMKEENGTLKRPTTEDTLIAWLKTSSTPVKSLFISDQPFCGYQHAVIKHLLPHSYPFDVAGRGVNPDAHPRAAAITLDSLARWLYQEELNRRY